MKMKKILTKAVAITLSLSLMIGGACTLSNVMIAEATSYNDDSHTYMESPEKGIVEITDFEYDEENDAYIIQSDDEVNSCKGILLDSYKFINYGKISIYENLLTGSKDITLKNIINYGTIDIDSKYTATATITESITNYGTITDPNSRISGKIITPKKITNPATSGTTPVTLTGKTIPAPQYTVTIPTAFDFGNVERVSVNETAANKLAETSDETVSVEYTNLLVNEKELSVTLSSDKTMTKSDSDDTISFELYDADNDENIATNTVIMTIGDTADSTKQTETFDLYATLDKSTIRTAGDYTGTVTFTVALTDKEAE